MQLAQLACNRLTLCVHRPTSSTAAFSPQYFQQSISSYFSLPTQLVTVCLFLQAKDQMICEFTFYCLNFVSSSQLRFRRRPKQSRLRRPVCTAPHLFPPAALSFWSFGVHHVHVTSHVTITTHQGHIKLVLLTKTYPAAVVTCGRRHTYFYLPPTPTVMSSHQNAEHNTRTPDLRFLIVTIYF